ncbi:MAG: hypothetical protein LBU27_07720 [Candidatus Peribacteria bacterium]|jgi:hypothetical protein|nr:hypothetical protein [Candidatus Peribacteria bacterium]
MSTPEKKPSFLYRVGIARLIVFSIIFIVVIIGTYCIKPDQVQAPSQPEELPFGNGHLKLGIIPVFTEGDTTEPDWQKGAVLDAYTDRVAFFAATRAVLLRPSVDIVLPHLNAKGCISPITSTTDPNPSKELIQAKAQLIDIEKVNALITIPCPTTAEHLEQGKEEIWQTLHRLFRLRNAGGFSGEVKGTYTFSGEETLLEQRLIELGGNKERQISTISTTEINNCSSLIVSGVSTENTQLCASSLQPCSPEQMAYEECFYNR